VLVVNDEAPLPLRVVAIEGLAKDRPLVAVGIGLAILGSAWWWWAFFPRYERQLRRLPGVYGRWPNTLLLAAMGSFVLLGAIWCALGC